MTASPLSVYGRQQIEDDDIRAVVDVLSSDFLTTGPTIGRFEQVLMDTVGSRDAVVCSNGTAALHLVSLGLGLGAGDTVIVPAITFAATANGPHYTGAEIVFADVDPATGLMGPDHLQQALSRAGAGAKAVFPVHLNGQPVASGELQAVAARHGLAMVEDGCHALGTTAAAGERVGDCAHADATVFSFHPVKVVASGEGGAITTNDAGLAARLRRLRSHGIVADPAVFEHAQAAFDRDGAPNPWYHEMQDLGFNYRLSDIHCALGISQMAKLARFKEKRAELVAAYDRHLGALAAVVRPIGRVPGVAPAWHLYPVLIDFAAIGLDRATVMRRLREAGIGTQVHYLPVYRHPYYTRRYGAQSLPGAEAYYARELSLPLHVGLSEDDVATVCDTLSRIITR